MAPTTRNDWLDVGLEVLRAQGEQALTIDLLSAKLVRTKGSFYHHFKDIAAYLAALLGRWEERNTTLLIDDAERESDPAHRRRILEAAARNADGNLDLAVRAWALRDPRARTAVSKVDARRIGYLTELRMSTGEKPAVARLRARLEYIAFVGAQQVLGQLTTREARALERSFEAAIAESEGEG